MNGNCSTTGCKSPERLPDAAALEQQWKSIDWKKAETEVNRLQTRIAKATQEKKWNTVKRLQYLLTHSYDAKVLAVRKVTTNKGKKTPGVDGELWSTPAAKMRGVLTLTDKGYKAKPLRRVFIEKRARRRNVRWASPVCMTGLCRRSTPWLSTRYQRQQRTQNPSASARGAVRRTLVNISSQRSAAGIPRSGCWRATSKGVLTISAMTGSLSTSQWTNLY